MSGKKRLFSSICDQQYGRTTPYHLFDAAKNSKEFVQKLQLQRKIQVHDGCVNSICWNDTGKYILSGSDDQHLSVVNAYDYSVSAFVETGHRANIFSAKFLPNTNDKNVVSCSGDGIIIYSNLDYPQSSLYNKFTCHRGTAYEIVTVANDSNSFLSCGEDKSVRWFDMRTKTWCLKEDCKDFVLINCQSPVTSLAVNPLMPYQLAVGCADASVRIFDRRMLATQTSGSSNSGFRAMMTCFTVPEFKQSRRITSLCYSADGQEVLVSYSSDYIYLFDVKDDFDKKPKLLSKNGACGDSEGDSSLFFRSRPLMKRLRVRGDWSDTGPNARPEAEARDSAATSEQRPTTSRQSVMRTMSDILARMFHSLDSSQSAEVASPAISQEVIVLPDETVTEDLEYRIDTAGLAGKKMKSSSPTESQNCSTNGTDPNIPSTSHSALGDEAKSSDKMSETESSDKSEQNCSNVNNDQSDVKKCDCSYDTGDHVSKESGQGECASNPNLNYQNIEEQSRSEVKDFIEKHQTEPSASQHCCADSVSNGPITVDESNRSENEQEIQVNEAGNEAESALISETESSLPNNIQSLNCAEPEGLVAEEHFMQVHPPPPEVFYAQIPAIASQPANSTQSETGTTVEPRPNSLPRIAHISLTPGHESSVETPEEEVELMMEVDSWDVDSDGEDRSERDSGRNCDEYSEKFISSRGEQEVNDADELEKEEAHLLTVSQPRVNKKFSGHRNARTMIKESTFWGDNFVMSGSDCGHIFIWDRHTTEVVMLMEGDHHVVNCLQPHPFDPVLASSGIDYDIKLWAPLRDEPFYDEEKATEIIKRNEIMLEETKDTITVPASFMFRMLTTFRNFRSARDNRLLRAVQELRRYRNMNRQDSI